MTPAGTKNLSLQDLIDLAERASHPSPWGQYAVTALFHAGDPEPIISIRRTSPDTGRELIYSDDDSADAPLSAGIRRMELEIKAREIASARKKRGSARARGKSDEDIVKFALRYCKLNGEWPAVSEITTAMGFSGHASTMYHVKKLVDQGRASVFHDDLRDRNIVKVVKT